MKELLTAIQAAVTTFAQVEPTAAAFIALETTLQDIARAAHEKASQAVDARRQELIRFHQARGWMNCTHKSLERLEAEYQAIKKAEPEND